VFLGFLYDLFVVGASPRGVISGLVPTLPGDGGLLLVCGIIGATVMPHVVYLHSALTKSRVACRDDGEKRELLRFQRLDVVVGLGAAGLINLSMLVIAASLFNGGGRSDIDSIEGAHAGLGAMVGGGAALAFAVALLASGLSSSSVGTYAGQVVMQGFIRRQIPLFLRRAITMAPALVVLGLGLPATDSLVISQVVLSFGIPFALVPLLLITRRRDIMGVFVNRGLTNLAAGTIAAMIIALNVYLLWDTFVG
jgi:manganese transport protein